MTIPRKGSRTIRVEGKKYRWMVSAGKAYDKRLTVEASNPRGFLQVILRPRDLVDENGAEVYWDRDEPPKSMLTPKEVSLIIVEAHRAGWPASGDLRGFKPKTDLAEFLVV